MGALPDMLVSKKLGMNGWSAPVRAHLRLEHFRQATLAFGAGLALYVARSSHRHPVRARRILVVVLLLVGTYLASTYGPSPPSMTTIAVIDIVFILAMDALAGWADRWVTNEELAARGLSHK